MNRILGMMPTTGTVRSQEVAIMVVQHSRHHYRLDNQRLRLSQQVDVHAYVVLHFLVTLYSRTSEEIWTCEVALRSHSNEVIVNNGEYRIISEVYPQRGTVISTSKLDFEGQQLPPHACTFTLIIPADTFPTSYNATFHLLRDEKNGFFGLCDETYYCIQTNLQGLGLFTFQEGILSNIEYPVPRIKLKGVLGCIDGWRIIMHFESLADNGEFRRYRHHRQLLEALTRNRPRFQDLLAMVLLEEGVACLIQDRLREGVAIAKKACRLSIRHSCVNDRAILGYAYAVYAAAARFAGDLGGAKRYLYSALEIFEPMEPSTYSAITLYNIGAIIMEQSASVGVSDAEEKEAEKALRLAEQHWKHQTLNTTFRVLPRICNRLISLYLKSSPNTAPDLTVNVSQQGLARADEKIRMVEAHLLPHFTNWLSTTFYLAKTDFYIRTGDTDRGLQAAEKSLQIATQFGLQRERRGANTRIFKLQEIRTQGEPADML